jgi:hypothetical protein
MTRPAADMTDPSAAAGDRHPDGDAFTVAATAIPVGIRCRRCGRLHLPARPWPRSIRQRASNHTEIELACALCNAAGTLLLDHRNPDHHALLAIWRDAQPDGDSAGEDPEAAR